MLLSLVTWLWYVNPYLWYVLTAVLFITSGKRIRITILLYCIIWIYGTITALGTKSALYLCAALWSFPYLRCYLSKFINNRTHSTRKTGGHAFPHSFTPPLSFRLVITAFENFEYPWDAQASMFLLLCLLNGFQVLFRAKQVVNNIAQRSALRLDSYELLDVWNSMGKYLGWWTSLVFWNFTPEQVQNPDKLIEYLEEVCCHPGISRDTQIIAMCWGLVRAY